MLSIQFNIGLGREGRMLLTRSSWCGFGFPKGKVGTSWSDLQLLRSSSRTVHRRCSCRALRVRKGFEGIGLQRLARCSPGRDTWSSRLWYS